MFECLAIADGFTAADGQKYREKWGKNHLDLVDEPAFAKMFNYRLQIWKIEEKRQHNFGTLIFGNRADSVLPIAIDDSWEISSERISLTDNIRLIKNTKILNYFECEDPDCVFVTGTEAEAHRHFNAHAKDRVFCEQQVYGSDKLIIEKMKQEGLLPNDFRQKCGIYWDVESLLVPSEKGLRHIPISIAATKAFGNQKEFFFCRDDMTPDSLKHLINNFVNMLEESYVEFTKTLPEKIWSALKILCSMVKQHHSKDRTLQPSLLAKYEQYIKKLKDITQLKIFSFCGERYDIPVLKGALFNELFRRDCDFSVIMRGSGIMQFQFKNIISRDIVGVHKYTYVIGRLFLNIIM
mgnify:CR=1 FL=1